MKKILLPLVISCSVMNSAYGIVDKLDITENRDGSVTKTVTTLGGKLDSFTRTHLEAYGETELSNGTITNDLLISGNLAFKNLEVRGNSSINGDFRGDHGRFRSLTVIGKTHITNTDVLGVFKTTGPTKLVSSKLHGMVNIIGKLSAQDTRFSHNLTVTSPKVKLKNSFLAKNLHIKNMHNSEVQTLYIDRDSTIRGVIEFESGVGSVIDESGKIKAVQIKGGTLQAR